MILEEQFLNAKILIVDDEPDNVNVLEKMLKLAGYTSLQTETDSRKVEAIYRDFLPDLVLLDLNMPHLNGFQVMDKLKDIETNSYLSVLVLTALHDDETLLRTLDFGARDFIQKPFDSHEVLSRMRNLIEMRLLHKQLENQNQILEKKVQERTKDLQDSRLEVVRRLGRAAEYRDNETGLHIIRMSKMGSLIGRAAGVCDRDCDLLLNASPMHDIGKIGIPDKVLLKPGKLNADEWKIMKTHTTIGANLLSEHDSELMEVAYTIAITHHEKWDGTGYPKGLKEEDIPAVGRVCALADVFDALTSKRLYKEAWSIEDSCIEIKRNSGKHFDPKLVEVFEQILPDLIRITKDYAEPLTKGNKQ